MLRKHLVKLASLAQEVIPRLINSAFPSSNNGHPRVTAQGTNTVLTAYCLYVEIFKKSTCARLFQNYHCLLAICIIQHFFINALGSKKIKVVMYPIYITYQNILRKA
jgi:hypothetical protein